ncbi:hypothetical protein QMO56_13215 [Roseomonas sp. E05]|nr:hypothetical protein [Roseomonas sp. E05]MDJ0389077.1 hypothetical protein [Roseomonas sp. E05]
MSDAVAGTYTLPSAPPADRRPSPAKGLLWGGALSLPLWAVIAWVATRVL